MPHSRSERQADLLVPEVAPLVEPPGDASLGRLVSQLAHEGVELVELELRRVRVEVQDKAGRAVSALVGAAIAFVFLGLASLAFAGGLFLVLARALGSLAGAAFATGGLLVAVALVVALLVRASVRELLDRGTREGLEASSGGRSNRGA
jgi:uncharacterized membrane protein YqjE